jgi:AraC-like DNA-binding protein
VTISLVETTLLVAASQGFFLSIFIFYRSRHLFANRFLGLVLFLYSFTLLDMFLWDVGFYLTFPSFRLLTIAVPLTLSPLQFLYARYLTRSFSKLKKIDLLHFLPFVAAMISFAILFFTIYNDHLLLMQRVDRGEALLFFSIFNWVIIFQIFPYMGLTLWILHRYEQDIKSIFSDIDKIHLHWLRNITIIIFAAASFFLIETVIYMLGFSISQTFTLTSIVVAASVYAMGYLALFKSAIFLKPEVSVPISKINELGASSENVLEKYAKSGLSNQMADDYLARLERIMQDEKSFLISDLTLTQLAEKLDISPHNLSEILNTRTQKNFFDYVNHFRVEAAKKELVAPDSQHFKILAIAFNSGFNSKTSFNTIFKKYTGQTPSQFRQATLSHSS